MARKKTRLTRSGNTVETHYLTTKPSGVTIDGPNAEIIATDFVGALVGTTSQDITAAATATLHGSVDFGQAAYKIYRGAFSLVSGALNPSGTTLSDGTVQITTGLTTIHAFVFSYESSSVTTGRADYPHGRHFQRNALGTGGGVTLRLNTMDSAGLCATCTPGRSGVTGWTGCTIHWIAVGV
ncbi:MAG: hypothetical protein ABID54_00245 [Pseudomonadota bacterium]